MQNAIPWSLCVFISVQTISFSDRESAIISQLAATFKNHRALSLQCKRFLGKMLHFQVLLWFTSVCKHRGDPQPSQYLSLPSDGLILDVFLASSWKQIQLIIAFSLVSVFIVSLSWLNFVPLPNVHFRDFSAIRIHTVAQTHREVEGCFGHILDVSDNQLSTLF